MHLWTGGTLARWLIDRLPSRDSGFVRFAAPGLILVVYLAAAGAAPVSVRMDQRYDDALFIRLGEAIASGRWLGDYNVLTLVKGPVFPLLLAGASFTGIPF